jgi:DNA (cytosine-5)-methyltransferase 1
MQKSLLTIERKGRIEMNKLNCIDLFSGCGGLSYGFESAGVDILLGIDNDKKALETFERNHKGAKSICGDITKIGYSDIKKITGDKNIDIIIGGPPCQGMSLSGPRKFDDPRNKLYLTYIRLVKEIQPTAFVIENVPGLVSLFGGTIKDSILEKFDEMGYTVRYRILSASDYGVPQNRKRVVFVGFKGNKEFIFPEKSNDIVTCEMALSDLPPLIDEIGDEVLKYEMEPQNDYQHIMRKHSTQVKNHIAANHSEQVKHIISLVPDGCNYKSLPDEYKNTRNFHVAWTRFASGKPAPTIDTGHRHHFHYKYNRVPTVRECARLQSFPDDFEFLGNKTQQFRQVGNAVPPILAQTIATELLKQWGD